MAGPLAAFPAIIFRGDSNLKDYELNMPTETIYLRSIQVGIPRSFPAGEDGKAWESAIIKQVHDGFIELTEDGLMGDRVADRQHHGGIDKAICIYPLDHYEVWANEFPQVQWHAGAFGENLSVSPVTESDVCVGDQYDVGPCRLEISQPREPCWKLSRRWQLPKLAVRVQQTRRTGWYARVIRGGALKAGMAWQLIARPYPQWTIFHANEVMFAQPRDAALDAELAACPALAKSWQKTLHDRGARQRTR